MGSSRPGHFVFRFDLARLSVQLRGGAASRNRPQAYRVTSIQVSALPPNSLFFIGFLPD
ncbi:protein of unknown function [Paraburkholderia dioscoreae]|uniref:Uncharacterized protein n=1 Tax=Paraburkholderia dioscoreae TaxID=2604047 RepID=A0A5Q4YV85_9BURK|nr:protein of unknown function [Paraburkholderia dioscoreae]